MSFEFTSSHMCITLMGSKMPKTRKRIRVMLKSILLELQVCVRIFWVPACYFHILQGTFKFVQILLYTFGYSRITLFVLWYYFEYLQVPKGKLPEEYDDQGWCSFGESCYSRFHFAFHRWDWTGGRSGRWWYLNVHVIVLTSGFEGP